MKAKDANELDILVYKDIDDNIVVEKFDSISKMRRRTNELKRHDIKAIKEWTHAEWSGPKYNSILNDLKSKVKVMDSMKVIKRKNGYTLAITNQGHGERIILMFPGETEKNPHMWLGLPTSENMKKAIETFEDFAKIKSKDSKPLNGTYKKIGKYLGVSIVSHKNKYYPVNQGNLVGLGENSIDDVKKAIEGYKRDKRYMFKDADWDNGMSSAKTKSKDSVLFGALKTLDAVEERIINKPETDANGIVADKRMFVKLYEDFKRERDPQNKVIIAKEMKKTLERIKKNSESDFDEEDVRQFSRVLEIVNRKAF